MRKKLFMWFGIGILVIVILVIAGRLVIIPAMSPLPDNLGWQGDSFTDCPNKPNCVSSTTGENRSAYIAPLSYEGTAESAHDAIVNIINNMPRSQIITDNDTYIHAEFRSLTMGYIDDIEFYIDTENNLIHVRSAARLGYGDMDVNRNRVESIRQQLEG